MTSEVECSGERKAFCHAHTCDEDGAWAEARVAAVAFSGGCMVAEEERDGIAEEEQGGRDGEEEDGEKDKGCVLNEVETVGAVAVEHF